MIKQLQAALQLAVKGQEEAIEDVLIGLLAGGHVLLEGVPGIGKTLLARTLAAELQLGMSRIQFTPDMLPSDVLGSVLYDMKEGHFRTERGPVFANVVLADEINRTPPKTQAALLEAMEERQVTLYGETMALPSPFFVIATQNPIEHEGTYPLPEAQLDRFLLKVRIGYPEAEAECAMLEAFHAPHVTPSHTPTSRASYQSDRHDDAVATIVLLQQQVEQVEVSTAIIRYIVELVRQSRDMPTISLGASPRAATAMLMASRAAAFLEGRSFVTPDDVKRIIHGVLGHRLLISPSAELEGVTPLGVVTEVVHRVVVPR